MKWLFRLIAVVGVTLRLRKDEGEELIPAESAHLDAALGDALRPDGNIDHERLLANSKPFDIDTLRRESDRGTTPVASPRRS